MAVDAYRRRGWRSRIGWFAALYVASLAAMAAVAWLLRGLILSL